MTENYIQLPLPGFEDLVPTEKIEPEKNWGIVHRYFDSYEETHELYTKEDFFEMMMRESRIHAFHGLTQLEFPETKDDYYFGNHNINDIF